MFMKSILITVFFAANCYLCVAQMPIKKCSSYTFDESSNLASKNISDIFMDSLHQIWVTANGRLQYFNGQYFSNVITTPQKVTTICSFNDNARFYYGDTVFLKLNIHSRTIAPATLFKQGDIFLAKGSAISVLTDLATGKSFLDSKRFRINIFSQHENNTLYSLNLNVFRKIDLIQHDTLLHFDPTIKPANENVALCFDYIFYLNDAYFVMAYNTITKTNTNTGIKVMDKTGVFRMGACKDKHGKILLGVNKKLYQLDQDLKNTVEYRSNENKTFLVNGFIEKILVDNFNNIYLLTLNEGLIKIINNDSGIKYYGFEDNNEKIFSKCIAVDKEENQVLIGTWGDGLHWYDTLSNFVKEIPIPELGEKPLISYISKMERNKYLLFPYEGSFLYLLHIQKDKKFKLEKLNVAKGNRVFNCDEFIINPSTSLIAASHHLLKVIKKPVLEIQKLLDYNDINGVTILGNKIIEVYNENISFHKIDNGQLIDNIKVPYGEIRCIKNKSDHEIYFGTDYGLYIMDVNSKIYRPTTITDKVVYAMMYDRQGLLWVSTSYGIYALDHKGEVLWLGRNDGLQDWEFNTNCVALADDGELFFGGVKGTNSFFPSKVKPNKDYFVYIDGVFSKNKNYNQKIFSNSTLKFPSESKIVSVRIGIYGQLLPSQYNKQYKIEGIANEWIDLGSKDEIIQAFPYGKFKLYYHASNKFDAKAQALNFITIEIATPFYLQQWFLSICALMGIGALIFVFNIFKNLQFDKTKALWEARESLNKERNRISKELHDFIGANLSIISRNINWIRENKNQINSADIDRKLEQIAQMSLKTNTDIRDTIWVTKKEALTVTDLFNRLNSFAYGIINENFKVTIADKTNDRILSSTVAINLLRICQEAIHNSLKYSDCDEVEIIGEVMNDKLRITISDKGRGFNYSEANERGNGLSNMKERTTEINFSFTIETSPLKGCKILITEQ